MSAHAVTYAKQWVFQIQAVWRSWHGRCAGQHPQHATPDSETFPIAPQAAGQHSEAFHFDTPSPDDAVMLARCKPSGAGASTSTSSRWERHNALALAPLSQELSGQRAMAGGLSRQLRRISFPFTDQKPGLVQRQHTLRRLYQRQVSSGACVYAGFRPLARFGAGLQIFTFRSHLKQTEQMIQVDDRCHMQQPPHQDSPTIEARPRRHGPPSHLTQYACAYSTQILIRTVMQAALEC